MKATRNHEEQQAANTQPPNNLGDTSPEASTHPDDAPGSGSDQTKPNHDGQLLEVSSPYSHPVAHLRDHGCNDGDHSSLPKHSTNHDELVFKDQ